MWWIVLGLLSISASIFFWSLVAISEREDPDVQETAQETKHEQDYFTRSNHAPSQTV